MDFCKINFRKQKGDTLEVYPEFIVDESKDLMVRGSDFYAVWDPETGLWNRKRLTVRKMIDKEIRDKISELEKDPGYRDKHIVGKYLAGFSTNQWTTFERYMRSIQNNFKQLDEKVAFLDTETKQEDYISRRLPYVMKEGDTSAWERMISTLYDPDERDKIEWAIGSVLSGDSKKIQKFLVFYGPSGTGKGTILDIVKKLFKGYTVDFKAENLVQMSDQFGLHFLASHPLIAIDADTNLSRIETNATLNKITSHDELQVNEKFKTQYPVKPICMLMLGTNKPVKITDAKSGIIRRLIDVEPSGRKIEDPLEYEELNERIEFELGAIAWHCLQVYKELGGRHAYDSYVPERMMYRTDAFFNFMEEKADKFIENEGVSANDLWAMWKDYCQSSGIEFTKKRFEIIDEAKNYFSEFSPTKRVGDIQYRSWLSGLRLDKLHRDEGKSKETPRRKAERRKKAESGSDEPISVDTGGKHLQAVAKAEVKEEAKLKESDIPKYGWLCMDSTKSLLDDILKDCPAQYEITDKDGRNRPEFKWEKVLTTLKELDTSRTHYVRKIGNLICIDFDLRDKDGVKDILKNLKAAGSSRWKPTYAEFSNSGKGIHLYYWYDGDINRLSSMFDDEIEIKVYPDDQLRALRRRVTRCNSLPIAHISSGLPLKEFKSMINWDGIKDEKHLRNLIIQAIKKECRPYGEEPKTVTCVKYIRDILKQAQDKGMKYDIHDLDEAIYAFAAHSKNNADECIRMYYDMELIWPRVSSFTGDPETSIKEAFKGYDEAPVIILDCEVIQNLTLVVYKELEPDGKAGIFKKNGPDKKCIRMYNPMPKDIEKLFSMRIVGHNVTGYDNYILYALWLGYSPQEIFQLSQSIIINGNRVPWREAKNISWTDTYDVSNDKKGLKKIEIEMHIPHKEMEIDWSKPLPESEWERLAQYCENDVLATEAYFLSKGWQADFKARKILAALTGMTVNDSTNSLTAQLLFGNVKEPWHEFIYPNLKEEFPEYRMEFGKSYYGDVAIGEGGRVYAEEGTYYDVITLDVSGMHPSTINRIRGFGPYTQGYEDLYNARIAIKHKDYESARKMFDGRLAPYLESDEDADALSHALKIALNSVYGMTAAHFQNRFKDPRNIDNWVAKRGALFMEKLRREVQARGGHVIHIKTDSIKLVKPTQELQDFVMEFGRKYGYTFEVESRYERICLVNHAVYIALRQKDDPSWLKECAKAKKRAAETETPYCEPTRWTATGAQFAHPYVFKRLFSHEPMDFWDFCETKTVKTSLYLDMNENLPDVSVHEKDKAKLLAKMKKLKKVLDNPDDPQYEQAKAEYEDIPKDIAVMDELIAKGHSYKFVGKAGEFMPIRPGFGGGLLMRKEETDGSYGYATGAKGYRWLESEDLKNLEEWKKYIDIRYFRGLVDVARDTISKYCDFDIFVNGEDGILMPEEMIVDYDVDPWMLPCKTEEYAWCSDCPEFSNENGTYFCKKGYNITNTILEETKEKIL